MTDFAEKGRTKTEKNCNRSRPFEVLGIIETELLKYDEIEEK